MGSCGRGAGEERKKDLDLFSGKCLEVPVPSMPPSWHILWLEMQDWLWPFPTFSGEWGCLKCVGETDVENEFWEAADQVIFLV